MKTALLIIDVQRGLCEDPWAAHDCAGLIARLNKVSEKARAASAPVIFIQHEEAEGLVADSQAWQLADGLQHTPEDGYIRKTTCDSFLRTNLEAVLRHRNVNHLIIGGLQSEFCVDSTTRGAIARGFEVTLISDGHSTIDNAELKAAQIIAHHNQTLSNIGSFGPRVTLSRASEIVFLN